MRSALKMVVVLSVVLLLISCNIGPFKVRKHIPGNSLVLVYVKLVKCDYHAPYGLKTTDNRGLRASALMKGSGSWKAAGAFDAIQNVRPGEVSLARVQGHKIGKKYVDLPQDLTRTNVKPNSIVFLGYFVLNGDTDEFRKMTDAEKAETAKFFYKNYPNMRGIPLDDQFPIKAILKAFPKTGWGRIARKQLGK